MARDNREPPADLVRVGQIKGEMMTTTEIEATEIHGEVTIELVEVGGPFRVTYSTIGHPATTHSRYEEAMRAAFAHARRFAHANMCRYIVADRRYEKDDVVDGRPVTMEDVLAGVPSGIMHRDFVVAVVGEQWLGKSRIGFDAAADAQAALQSHPATGRISSLRSYAASRRESAEKCRHTHPEIAETLETNAAANDDLAAQLMGDDWADHIDAADVIIRQENE